MKKITYGSFAEYILKKDKSKMRFVRNFKERKAYSVEKDFYKPLRDCILKICKQNKSIDELDNMHNKLSDARKKVCYAPTINGFKDFLQGRKYKWVNPERVILNYSDLDVIVNPELGLEIGNTLYFIKLHLNKERIPKEKVDLLMKIMQDSYKDSNKNIMVAVLDVRNGFFYTANIESDLKIPYKLDIEAQNWIETWNNLENT